MSMGLPADNYFPEPCAYCGADGKTPAYLKAYASRINLSLAQLGVGEDYPACTACEGRAYVLVLQPAEKCRKCEGTGRRLHLRCQWCNGSGWMFVQRES